MINKIMILNSGYGATGAPKAGSFLSDGVTESGPVTTEQFNNETIKQ
jgi:hypothetical protein